MHFKYASRVVVLSLMSVLSAAGCTSTADKGAVETLVKDALKGRKFELKSLTCPDTIVVKQGESITCKAVDDDGTPGEAKVTWGAGTDAEIETANEIDLKAAGDAGEAGLTAQVGSKVDVTCPAKIQFNKAGKAFTCDATVESFPGVAHKVDFTMGPDQKTLNSKLRPASQEPGAAPAAVPSGSAPAGSADPAAAKDEPAKGEPAKEVAGE